jgi:predicted outer membrane repeat protein
VNFISSGSIKDGSFSISSCEFNNFRYEMKSVVWAAYIKVNINYTVFYNIVPYTSAVYIGEGSEVNIQAIAVWLLNNGFEYRSVIRQNPFLILESTASVTIKDSEFSMNLVMLGTDLYQDEYTASLIYAKNFEKTITIKDCTFSNNRVGTALISLDVTTLRYTDTYTTPYNTEYLSAFLQDQLTWTHLVIENCTFSNNGGNYLVRYLMDIWPHNIALSALSFSYNYVKFSLIHIEKLTEISKYSKKGRYLSLTVNNTSILLFYSKQTAKFAEITINDNDHSDGIIYLKHICNVELINVTSTNNGKSDRNSYLDIMQPMLDDPDSYWMEASEYNDYIPPCTASYRFEAGSSLNVTNSTFTDDHCSDGIAGIYVKDDLANLRFEELSFVNLTSGSKLGGVLVVDSPAGTVSLGPSFNIEKCKNSKGPAGIGIATSNSMITYKESYCRTNTGAFGTCAAMTEVGLMTMTSVVFTDNTASTGDGAALYFSTGALASGSLQFSVQSCAFTNNKATTKNGGAMYLTSTGSIPALTLTISSTTFTSNYAKLQGSGVYISSSFELKTDSVIDSCSFTNNSSGKDAALMVLYSAGKLTVKNTPFKGSSGSNLSSSIYALFGSDNVGLEINSCEITSNAGLSTIFVSSSGVGNSLVTSAVNIHDNTGVGLIVQSIAWTETSSVIQRNSGGGLQMTSTQASLSGTKFISNSVASSGAGARFNIRSTFSCDNCEFTNNVSQNNGGAVMSEGESSISISNSSFLNNSATGSGSAVYVISSIAISKLKAVTIMNNSASSIGAIVLVDGLLTVEDCTLEGNTAVLGSPGIYAISSTLTVKRTKFNRQS